MISSVVSMLTIICMILLSSVSAQGSHFYTLPDAEMAAREEEELRNGFRMKSSKKSAIANKDWMGTPVSRQQQQNKMKSNPSLRKNKQKKEMTFENVDTIDVGVVKESIRNDQVTGSRTTSVRSPGSSERSSSKIQGRTYDFA